MPNDPPNLLEDPRVALAAERTLLAWVRTGLAMMGFGFVVARFGLFLRELHPGAAAPPAAGGSVFIGAGLVVAGVIVTLLSAVRHVQLLRRLQRGELYRPSVWSLAVGVALLLSAFGIVMTVRLIATDS